MSKYLIIFSMFFLASCGGMPKHVDVRSDEQPTIYFDSSAIGAEVYIDGEFKGVVSKKQRSFLITPGKHELKIVISSGKVTQQSIFVQSNTRREISLNQ